MAENRGGRKAWIDFGRGISMYLVVLFHSETYFDVSDFALSPYVAFFRIPFFFFLSGYLFVSDYRNFSFRHKLVQVLSRIVWTYIIFTSLIVLPKSLANHTSLWDGLCDILLGRASWFIVSLGLAQMMWAVVMSYSKRLGTYLVFMLLSLFAGGVIKVCHFEPLPYWFDCALIVNFFLGLGFFYRVYEAPVSRILSPSVPTLLLTALLYFGFTLADHVLLGTNSMIFVAGDHRFFPLSVIYAMLGIAMMTVFVKVVPAPKEMCFIGIHSLVFYYLNGGVIRVLCYVSGSIGFTDLIVSVGEWGYVFVVLMSVCASGVLAITALLIERYAPVLTGDRPALKRMLHKMGVKI